VHQVVARIKYLLTDDPDLWFDGPWGSSTPIDDRPGLRDGYYELARALACGFGRTEPHPDAPLADRPRLLARLMAEDEELSGLIGRVAARKLADHVGRRLTREDIDTLREEVRLEFAGLSSWGSEFRKRVASLQAFSGAGGRPRGRDYSPTELRRLQFAYELVCDLRIGLKDGVEKFREREEREKDWYPISSIPGLTDAARRYALHSGKPLPPKRRGN
jgi:hypothetical protein